VRAPYAELVRRGVFPDERDAGPAEVSQREAMVRALPTPPMEEETRALVPLFGNDSFFGLAWSLLHLIEADPAWPYWDELTDLSNPWRARLYRRLVNAGQNPPR
jgi:hypothetical protein